MLYIPNRMLYIPNRSTDNNVLRPTVDYDFNISSNHLHYIYICQNIIFYLLLLCTFSL